MDMFIYEAMHILRYAVLVVMALIGLAGIVGAALCATTREDAFTAGDRQQKWVWFGILLGASLGMFLNIQILHWVGMVVIGIYWFDVRPQLKDIVNGGSTW